MVKAPRPCVIERRSVAYPNISASGPLARLAWAVARPELDPGHFGAAGGHVAGHIADEVDRHDRLDAHDRLEQHRAALVDGLLEPERAGHLESHLARIDLSRR